MTETIGELTSGYASIAAEISNLNAQVSALESAKQIIAEQLMDTMKQEGLESVKNQYGSFSIGKKTVPSVKSWEDFYDFIRENNSFHLLERRPSAKACVEEVSLNGTGIPGVEIIDLDRLAVRKA